MSIDCLAIDRYQHLLLVVRETEIAQFKCVPFFSNDIGTGNQIPVFLSGFITIDK